MYMFVKQTNMLAKKRQEPGHRLRSLPQIAELLVEQVTPRRSTSLTGNIERVCGVFAPTLPWLCLLRP